MYSVFSTDTLFSAPLSDPALHLEARKKGRPRKPMRDPHSTSPMAVSPDEDFLFIEHARATCSPNLSKRKRAHVMRRSRCKTASSAMDRAALLAEPQYGLEDGLHKHLGSSARELLRFYGSNEAAASLFPIESLFSLNPATTFWIPLAIQEPILLHCVFFACHHFQSTKSGRVEDFSTVQWLSKATKSLLHVLQDPDGTELSDAALASIAGIAIIECSIGNYHNWATHMEGLRRIVKAKGCVVQSDQNHFLIDKICRADMAGSMHFLIHPYLRLYERQLCSVDASHDQSFPEQTIYDALFELAEFCAQVDVGCPSADDRSLSQIWRKRLRLIQYRTLLRYDRSSLARNNVTGLQLGVLLFTGIVQNEIKIDSGSENLVQQIRFELEAPFPDDSTFDHEVRLWLICIASPILSAMSETSWYLYQFRRIISVCGLIHWEDVSDVLIRFAWLECVYGSYGKILYTEAMDWDFSKRLQRSK